jgi:hypothetical protein
MVNTNIAATVAPLINPKNVEELEVERGGYSSEYGDRTYGFFNVVTPSGNQLRFVVSFKAIPIDARIVSESLRVATVQKWGWARRYLR